MIKLPDFSDLHISRLQLIGLIITILLLISIPVGIYLFQKVQIFKPRAQISTNLTKQLLDTKKIYDNPNQGVKIFSSGDPKEQALAEMISISQRRKEELLKLARENPKAFLVESQIIKERSQFPTLVQSNLEQKVNISGKLRIFHIDFNDPKNNKFSYQLESADQSKKFDLFFADKQPYFPSGTDVIVEGVALESSIVLEFKDIIKKPSGKVSAFTTPSYPGARGEQKTAVILANFQNNQSQPISKEAVSQMLFDQISGAKSVNNFYRENSYEQTTFSGDVFGWFTIDLTNQGCLEQDRRDYKAGYEKWSDKAKLAALNAGVDFPKYQRVVFVFPAEDVCSGVAGVGEIGGVPSTAWIFTPSQSGVFGHELGHNLGLHHAAADWCGDKTLDDYAKCQYAEYGDPFDIMGKAQLHHFNGPHKYSLDWLSASNIKTVNTSGTYTLSPLEIKTDQPQIIKIPKQDEGDAYFLEYRKAVGFDADFRPTMTDGAALRIWYGYFDLTHLLDLSPQNPPSLDSYYDATFKDGQTYQDPVNGITIKQLSHTPDSVTLEINISKPAIGSWKITTPLPEPTSYSAAVTDSKHVYLIGGGTPNDEQKEVYFASVNKDGTIGSWSKTADLPAKPLYHMAVYFNGYIFVMGGDIRSNDPANYTYAAVYSAKIQTDGSLSAWRRLDDLPKALETASAAVSDDGYIFISGGTNYPDFFQTAVYSARINDNGTLEPWQKKADLPKKTVGHSSAFYNGYLYVLGGGGDFEQYLQDGGQISFSDVYAAKVTEGSLGPWQSLPKLPVGLKRSSLIVFNNKLLVFGGYHEEWYNSAPKDYSYLSADIYQASVNPDGTIGVWSKAAGISMPKAMENQQAVSAQGNIFLLGGSTRFFLQSTVYSTSLSNFGESVTLSGKVTDQDGNPVPDVAVNSGEHAGSCGIGSAKTNNNGIFVFNNIPKGKLFCLRIVPPSGFSGPDVSYECQYAAQSRGNVTCGGGQTLDQPEDDKYNFVLTRNTAIPAPWGLSYSCLEKGTKAKLYWSALPEQKDYPFYFLLRFNRSPVSVWAPNDPASGDMGKNLGKELSYTADILPDTENTFSVQTVPVGKTSNGSGEQYYDPSLTRSDDLTFSCPGSTPAPSSPGNLTSSCLGNNQVRLSWDPVQNSDRYLIRIDDTTNPWGGYSLQPGDILDDNVTINSYTATIAPAHDYNWWIHSVFGTTLSKETHGQFNCP